MITYATAMASALVFNHREIGEGPLWEAAPVLGDLLTRFLGSPRSEGTQSRQREDAGIVLTPRQV